MRGSPLRAAPFCFAVGTPRHDYPMRPFLAILLCPLLAACAIEATGTADAPQRAAGSCHARGHGRFTLPDRRCTPGLAAPAVTQANIASTICRAGYTKKVRPPESVTRREKLESMKAYGDTGSPRRYEYDHLISLELGGAPNDAKNLWPEPGASPNPKDRLENRLHAMVCDGSITLAQAQREIATNWVKAYHRLIG
jgi:hypothetical protein